eukprot:TRINITY_DN24685_c0_g1_i1.p1 TRINITY_DN24685_c0_g1~~TRINITY_DN24685_c0_g1_i1.p1  ORF type:complete len:432 (-),score=45.82 TRINITY_DN24685_c0_g1_i1:41-1222(-)
MSVSWLLGIWYAARAGCLTSAAIAVQLWPAHTPDAVKLGRMPQVSLLNYNLSSDVDEDDRGVRLIPRLASECLLSLIWLPLGLFVATSAAFISGNSSVPLLAWLPGMLIVARAKFLEASLVGCRAYRMFSLNKFVFMLSVPDLLLMYSHGMALGAAWISDDRNNDTFLRNWTVGPAAHFVSFFSVFHLVGVMGLTVIMAIVWSLGLVSTALRNAGNWGSVVLARLAGFGSLSLLMEINGINSEEKLATTLYFFVVKGLGDTVPLWFWQSELVSAAGHLDSTTSAALFFTAFMAMKNGLLFILAIKSMEKERSGGADSSYHLLRQASVGFIVPEIKGQDIRVLMTASSSWTNCLLFNLEAAFAMLFPVLMTIRLVMMASCPSLAWGFTTGCLQV